MKKQRLFPSLMILGASILVFRTIRLLTVENGWEILVFWIILLTFMEMLIDLLCILFSFQWLIKNAQISKSRSLRFGAAAAFLHAFRVLLFVLGRVGPWKNFDVKPNFHSTYYVDIFWVYFASILAFLGVLGVVIIWHKIRKNKNLQIST